MRNIEIFSVIFVSAYALCAVLLMVPVGNERHLLSNFSIGAAVLVPSAIMVMGWPEEFACASVMTVLSVYLGMRIYFRCKVSFHLSCKTSKAVRVACEARMFYSSLCLLLGFVFVLLRDKLPGWWVTVPVGILLSALIFRVVSGRPLFINVRPPRAPAGVRLEEDLARAGTLMRVYEKAEQYMKEQKPYANGPLPEDFLARMIGVNRTDLSRAIGWYASKNYSQYVNDYRVEYACDLMARDPYMKVTEVGRMSGFRSEGAFTTVFKDRMGQTPSEYARHERYKKSLTLEFPSSLQGQVR